MTLYVVGFGAGSYDGMTLEAQKALFDSEIIVGYTVYTDLLKPYFPQKVFLSTGMTKERDRVILALETAKSGKTTSLVCSGDSGVYGMAELALRLSADYQDVDVEIVAGVTAALSGGAVLGAPLTHDFCVISLSDLMIPWELIEKRLECASMADFVIVLYNPSSKKRADYLERACEIIIKYKSADTICGYVRNIGREGEESHILLLGELKRKSVDMFTTVYIGNNETVNINGKMITPRGYKYV